MLANSGTGIQLKTLRVVCYFLLYYVRPSLIKVKNINNTENFISISSHEHIG